MWKKYFFIKEFIKLIKCIFMVIQTCKANYENYIYNYALIINLNSI